MIFIFADFELKKKIVYYKTLAWNFFFLQNVVMDITVKHVRTDAAIIVM